LTPDPPSGSRRPIDLHAHTTASDGSLTPTELVQLAVDSGLAALAVTDHDTFGGLPEAREAADRAGLELIPGVELNVVHPSGKFHLLGYLFDPHNPALSTRLRDIQQFRASRNDLMVARMQECGLPITMEDIVAESGGDQIGRPHMALAMLHKGLVSTTQEAFDKYLADGALCHLPKDKMEPEEGIELIRGAGGVPVMAHPGTLKLDGDALEADLRRFQAMGLQGLECFYSQHTPEREEYLVSLANKLGLAATGGSDFHGASKPLVRLGVIGGASPQVPYAVLDEIRSRR
jgi:3',5'-nucleoside bisphosphate phosphatase